MIELSTPTVAIDGIEYQAELARTERTTLGYEDHGIFTAVLHFAGTGGGWGQSNWAPCLSHNDKETRKTVAWPGGLQFITDICDVYGTDWEKIPGSLVYVLRRQFFGDIEGIMNHLDHKRFMLFKPTLTALSDQYPTA